MIYDSLENLGRYRCLGESFARAVDALQARDLFSLADGRYEIDEKNYFAVSQPALKPREGSRYEAHRLYADIQIALTQGETIDVAPVAALGDWDEYDPQNDIVFTGDTAPCVELPLHRGMFAVFFPWDAHRPCLGEGTTKKIVVKVFMG